MIESEVRRLAGISIVLVIGLLWLAYRSLTLLVLGLLPVISGALAGVAAVSLGFGHVHGLTLGFGTTLIGEAVDYSIYFFIQKGGGDNPQSFWRTIRLGVLTSIVGFAALLVSGFPGLAQLGMYSISGLLCAVLVTRFVLPDLVPANIAVPDFPRLGNQLNRVIEYGARLRWGVGLLLLAALTSIVWHRGDVWNRQLSALSPISRADQEIDAQLRADMGAPDTRYVVSVTAPTEQAALEQAERVGGVLQKLLAQNILGGFTSPAQVWPSHALQRTRQAALPEPHEALQRLSLALQGLPLRPEKLDNFIADLAAARARAPLDRAELAGSSAGLLVDSLLIPRSSGYLALIPLHPNKSTSSDQEIDLQKVRAAFDANGLNQVIVIDLLNETTLLFNGYLLEASWLSGLGCLAIVALLLVSLRSVKATLNITLPLACAVACVTAGLLAFGIQLTILHLTGLLLVVAVGSNYALFFATNQSSKGVAERHRMQVSLVVANLATVSSFGVLGISKVPVLAALGVTVGWGAFLALIFSTILTHPAVHESSS